MLLNQATTLAFGSTNNNKGFIWCWGILDDLCFVRNINHIIKHRNWVIYPLTTICKQPNYTKLAYWKHMLTSVYIIYSLSELGQCHNNRFLLFPFLFQVSFYVISILFVHMYESISLMTSKCWTRDLLQFLWNVTIIINVHHNYTYATYTKLGTCLN